MKISIKGYITSKKSELFYDCADRYAYDKSQNKFAISDGVSKSFFPKIWADILVNKWVASKEFDETDFLLDCQNDWLEQVTEIANNPDAKWYTKNAFNKKTPGLATFVNLHFFEKNKKWIWQANALGDSFMFFVPKDHKNFSKDCTILSSKQEPIVFDNFPDYLSSIGNTHKGKKQDKDGQLALGTFYLMTDALAEWFISENDNAIHKISVWQNQKDFERFIDEERLNEKLGNDDSAILIIEIKDDKKKNLNYNFEDVSDISELIKIQQNALEEAKKNKEQELTLQAGNLNPETESEQNLVKITIENKHTEIKNSEQKLEGIPIENKPSEVSEPLLQKKGWIEMGKELIGFNKPNPIIVSGETELEEVSSAENKEVIEIEKNEELTSDEPKEEKNLLKEEVIENEINREIILRKPNKQMQNITDKF